MSARERTDLSGSRKATSQPFLRNEIFPRNSLLSHSSFFHALLTLPLTHYSHTSDVALSPRNDPSYDLVSSVL